MSIIHGFTVAVAKTVIGYIVLSNTGISIVVDKTDRLYRVALFKQGDLKRKLKSFYNARVLL